jgi:hypothetical protein
MNKNLKYMKSFEDKTTELNISDVMNSKIMDNMDNQKNNKMEKLKELLELVSEVDIMYHEEHKEYFFEWMKDGKFIFVWLGDYV